MPLSSTTILQFNHNLLLHFTRPIWSFNHGQIKREYQGTFYIISGRYYFIFWEDYYLAWNIISRILSLLEKLYWNLYHNIYVNSSRTWLQTIVQPPLVNPCWHILDSNFSQVKCVFEFRLMFIIDQNFFLRVNGWTWLFQNSYFFMWLPSDSI